MPSRRHRFKTLSEAVLAGCGKQPSTESGGALRAAWNATFVAQGDLGSFHSANLRDIYPELRISTADSCPRGPDTSCPEWPKRSAMTLEAAIYHLEGVHQLKPEDVAGVDSLQENGGRYEFQTVSGERRMWAWDEKGVSDAQGTESRGRADGVGCELDRVRPVGK